MMRLGLSLLLIGHLPIVCATQYAPIVLVDQTAKRIEACGVSAETETAGGSLRLELRQVRAPGDPQTVFQVWLNDTAGRPLAFDGAVLHTPSASTASFAPRSSDDATFAAVGRLAGAAGGQLFRELLLGSAEVVLNPDAGEARTVALPGPAPLRVNKTYLYCSGDMYR